jgi:hypothetical protein
LAEQSRVSAFILHRYSYLGWSTDVSVAYPIIRQN